MKNFQWNNALVKKFARVYCGNEGNYNYIGLNIDQKLKKFIKETRGRTNE